MLKGMHFFYESQINSQSELLQKNKLILYYKNQ